MAPFKTPQCLQPLVLPWTVSAVLSLACFFFYFQSEGCQYAPSGFCITNYVPDSGICPSKTDNSHFWAFFVDVLFTVAVLFIGFNPKLFPKQQGKKNSITLAFIIIAHGLLHFFLGYIKDCASPPATEPAPVLDIALYAGFIFVLCGVAFLTTSSVKPVPSFFVSVGFTYLIVKASLHATPANVGTIFGGTQWLASVLGAFVPKNPPNAGTQKQGLFFIAPCAVSLSKY